MISSLVRKNVFFPESRYFKSTNMKAAALACLILSMGNTSSAHELLEYDHGAYYYQQNLVTGLVTDINNSPLQGVTISVKEKPSISTSTDVNGRFVLNVEVGQTLVIKLVGHTSKEVVIDNSKEIAISLEEDVSGIDEVVVVGFGTQKKESNVGSQATIKREELKVPTANLTTAIAGRLSGVVATQRGGGPGASGADLFVRGVATFASSPQGPLLVVDGIPDRGIDNIDPEDIESFTILKDATATAVYGTRGANGVILINTRKGKAGKPNVAAEVQNGVTGFTYLPQFVDAPTFMNLYNEGLTLRGKPAFYSNERIDLHANGTDPDLYPNVDWFDMLFKDFGGNHRANVNISGGADIAKYYLSLGYYGENGQFKTADVESFNSALKYNRFNFTSNLDINLTKTTKVNFGVNGYLSNYNRPGQGRDNIFALAAVTSPHIIPAQYSNGQWPRLAGTGLNPYQALTQSGIQNSYDNVVRSNLKLSQDLSVVTEGLTLEGTFAFDAFLSNSLNRSRDLQTYFASGRDDNGELITNVSYTGTEDLSFSLTRSTTRRLYSEANLRYSRTFGAHDVGGLLLFNQSDFSDAGSGVSTYQGAIPYRQRSYVGRGNYTFDRRYSAEANFSYSGSDTFDPANRYGLFYSVGAGWMVSNEEFFKPLTDVISHFKLRYSYGTSGNGSLNSADARFLYLTRFSSTGSYSFGDVSSLRSYTGYNEGLIGGVVTWETSKRNNLGVEMNFFNNDIQLIVELFKEHRTGILLRDYTLPYVSGFNTGNIPYRNVGETKNKGIDVTLEYNKRMTNGFFMARGTMNYNSNKVIKDGQPAWAYPHLDRMGQRISQRFGYIATGLFKTDEEIQNAATQAGDVRVGDIRYKDLNGDGLINSMDQTAIGYGAVPLMTYGLTLGGGYKGFDLSLFFQGTGLVDFSYASGFGTTPFSQGATYGNMFTTVLDRWDPANPDKETLYPRLSTNETTTTNYYSSTWWTKRADYIRLKQAELGYNFNNTSGFLKKLAINKVRLYANGTNLFTISKWDFWDPELGDGRGLVYPLTRVYNVGLRVNFQ